MARYCAYCGQPLSEGAKFCGFCGGPVPDAEPTPRQDPFAQNPQPEPESPETPEAPEQPAAFKEQYRDGANSWQDSPKPKRKQRKTLGLIALVCGATVALLLVGGFLWPGFFRSAGTAPSEPVGPRADTQPGTSAPIRTEAPATTVPQVTVRPNPFQDVSEDSPCYEACLWALDQGVIKGDTVEPAAVISRAQAVTFLWRAMGSPKPAAADCPFQDVEAGKYFYKPLLWCLEKGVLSSDSDSLQPEEPATRSFAAAILCRALEGSAEGETPVFLDTPEGKWYTAPAAWAYEKGIVPLDGSRCFLPNSTMERGEFLSWLARAMDPALALEPAQPKQESFRKLGISINLTAGGAVPLQAAPKENPDQSVKLTVEAQSYEIFDSREGYSGREGYRWHLATFLVRGPENDYNLLASCQDANNVRIFWQTRKAKEDGSYTAKVLAEDGSLLTVLVRPVLREAAKDAICQYTLAVQVPNGYDGLCFCLCDSAKAWGEDQCLADVYTSKEDFVLFRMD